MPLSVPWPRPTASTWATTPRRTWPRWTAPPLPILWADAYSVYGTDRKGNELVPEQLSITEPYLDVLKNYHDTDCDTLTFDWKKGDPHPVKTEEEKQDEEDAVSEDMAESSTVVEISKLVRPGMALSGSVKFASGSTADWYIDATGRLGLENLVGEKPTPEDIQQFQIELQKAVSGGR